MTGVALQVLSRGCSLIGGHIGDSTVSEMLRRKVDVWGGTEILQMLIFNECCSHKQS